MESWSGTMEWHIGVKFFEWTGMKSDFEFFAVPPFFLIFTVCIHMQYKMR